MVKFMWFPCWVLFGIRFLHFHLFALVVCFCECGIIASFSDSASVDVVVAKWYLLLLHPHVVIGQRLAFVTAIAARD